MKKSSGFDKNGCYSLGICGRKIIYRFIVPETHLYFGEYIRPADCVSADICVSREAMEEKRHLFGLTVRDGYLECQTVMIATGNYLLEYGCALFHCVSFVWRNLAWLLTAPSGTGKTTQLINWLKLYNDQTTVINGDKTGLECRDDGSVYAYSSPWRGKESMGTRNQSARLGGIILLKQGAENQVRRLVSGEAVYPLYKQFISYPESRKQIMDQRDILERVLDTVPVWELVNRGDEDSTVLLYHTLEGYMDNRVTQSEEYV